MKMITLVSTLTLVSLMPLVSRAQNLDPIIAEAVIEAPVQEVWDLWTTGEGLRAWMAPHAEITMEIGGLMRSNYNPAGSLDDGQAIENEILSFDPLHMMSIRVAKAPENFPFLNTIKEMWTVLYFDETASGSTAMRIVGMGFTEDEESQNMRGFFERGNEITLRQLQDHVSTRN